MGINFYSKNILKLLDSLFISIKKDEKIRGIAKILDILKSIIDLLLIHIIKDNIFYF